MLPISLLEHGQSPSDRDLKEIPFLPHATPTLPEAINCEDPPISIVITVLKTLFNRLILLYIKLQDRLRLLQTSLELFFFAFPHCLML